jgi:hypothetical protein
MFGCRVLNDAEGAFVECLQSDRGPIDLCECQFDSQILPNALTGKSRVTKLMPPYYGGGGDKPEPHVYQAKAV